jgi:nucleotide-binding universal stress UspA family protein
MTKPILAGLNPRKADHAPVAFGAVTARLTGARLIVASVRSGAPESDVAPVVITLSAGQETPVALEVDPDVRDDCVAAFEQIEAEARAWRLHVDCLRLYGGRAARALHEAAEEHDAGLVVVGSSRERRLGGSTAERLLQGAPCPVAVVPPDWRVDHPIATVGVGYDRGDAALEAVRAAHALARRAHATLRVIAALEDVERAGVESDLRDLGDDVPVEVEVLGEDPADALIDASDEVDVLVCASRRYGPLRAVLLGDVTRRVTAEARCPVIVLPRGVKGALEALVSEAVAAPA